MATVNNSCSVVLIGKVLDLELIIEQDLGPDWLHSLQGDLFKTW